MNDISFKWTDELVKKFYNFCYNNVFKQPTYPEEMISRFKSSHTTKEEEVELPVGTIVFDNWYNNKAEYTKVLDGKWQLSNNSPLFTIKPNEIGEGKRFVIKTIPKEEVGWEIVEGGYSKESAHPWLTNDKAIESCEKIGCKIFSVRRKSDGVVFSVGDEFDLFGGADRRYKIDKFYQNGIFMYAVQTNYPDCAKTVSLPHLIKLQPLPKRTKLFTTEDGAEIFHRHDGELWRVFTSNSSYEKWKPYNLGVPQYINLGEKYFSTEEKAKEYILLNKPCLSVNEAVEIWAKDNYFPDKIKELAKSKLH